MFKKLLCFALLSLILFSCSSSYEKVVDGVIIHLNKTDGNAKLLKLTVINDKVILVTNNNRNRNFGIVLKENFILSFIVEFIGLMLT